MKHPIPAGIFVVMAVLGAVVGCAGIVRARGAAARLHFATWMGLVSPVAMAVAVLCEEGFSQAGLKALLIALLLTVEGPLLAHVLGRAIYTRERAGHRAGESQ